MPPKDKKVASEVIEPRGEHKGLSYSGDLIDVMVGTPKQVWTVESLAERAEIDPASVELYLRVLADAGVVRRVDADTPKDTYLWMWVGLGPGGRG